MAVSAHASRPAEAAPEGRAPWHGVAYGYLNAVFLLNLRPVDWPLIERVLTTDHDGRVIGRPASERLIDLDRAAGTAHWQAIETSLATRNADAFYAAATRALSAAIRYHLAAAAAMLDHPGLAGAEIDEAQALFRALAQGVEQVDPEGFHILALAWLELASSVRQSDAITSGDEGSDLPASRESFSSARTLLTSYLARNFEPSTFAPRTTYAPLPEERFIAEPEIALEPWLPPGSSVRGRSPWPRRVLNAEARGVEERDLFLVAYGDMLFESREIFGDTARNLGITCAACHSRGDINRHFFIVGLSPYQGAVDIDGGVFNQRFDDHRADPLDIPSLRGLRFTAPYGRDGRFASLRDFTRHVIVNWFDGPEPSPLMLDALVAYMQELDFLPAPHLQRDGSLTHDASDAAKRGERLFHQTGSDASRKACADCHRPDSHFTDRLAHDIGSAGEGALSGFSGAFATPTLLGIAETAPYFHDGRFGHLADLVAWKNETQELGLNPAELADLTAYLQAAGEAVDPYRTSDTTTPFELMIQRQSMVLSTLEILIPEQDRYHADLLLRTVAGRMELTAARMVGKDERERTLGLAETLWQLRDLILQERWDEAANTWQDCKKTADAFRQASR